MRFCAHSLKMCKRLSHEILCNPNDQCSERSPHKYRGSSGYFFENAQNCKIASHLGKGSKNNLLIQKISTCFPPFRHFVRFEWRFQTDLAFQPRPYCAHCAQKSASKYPRDHQNFQGCWRRFKTRKNESETTVFTNWNR